MNDATILQQAKEKALKNVKSRAKYYQSIGQLADEQAAVIFSHEFAKAFWGDEPYDTGLLINDDTPEDDRYGKDYDGREYLVLPAWQYHLQQMVLAENPIKYLEQFLQEGGISDKT